MARLLKTTDPVGRVIEADDGGGGSTYSSAAE